MHTRNVPILALEVQWWLINTSLPLLQARVTLKKSLHQQQKRSDTPLTNALNFLESWFPSASTKRVSDPGSILLYSCVYWNCARRCWKVTQSYKLLLPRCHGSQLQSGLPDFLAILSVIGSISYLVGWLFKAFSTSSTSMLHSQSFSTLDHNLSGEIESKEEMSL